MDKKKKGLPIILIIIFVLIVAGLYAYLYLLPRLTGSLRETYIVDKGSLIESSDLKAIVVREEHTVDASASGSISCYSKENEKTRKNHTVADIYSGGERHSLVCEKTGIISYFLDGYENVLSPTSLGAIDIADYIDLDVVPQSISYDSVSKGDPVFKLITSNTWYFMLIIPKEDKSQYAINSSIKICLEDSTVIPASVVRYIGLGDTIAVVASTKTYYEDFAKLRCVNVNVIKKEIEGYIIPTTAIAQIDVKVEDTADEKSSEKTELTSGIYVLGTDGEYKFKKIEILGSRDDETLISADGNIKIYDEILRDAKTHK